MRTAIHVVLVLAVGAYLALTFNPAWFDCLPPQVQPVAGGFVLVVALADVVAFAFPRLFRRSE